MSPQASLEKYGEITNKFFRLTGILSHGVEISESDWPMLNAILTETAEYLTEFRGVPTDNRLYDFAFKQAVSLRNRVHGLISSRESYLIDLDAARTILSFAETFSVIFRSGNTYSFHSDFFSRSEALWNQTLFRYAPEKSCKILEIGCFEGFSTCWFLENLVNDAESEIFCIDPFRDSYFSFFEKNLISSRKKHQVTIIRELSRTGLRRFKQSPKFHVVHIDDYELYDSVSADFPVKSAVDSFLQMLGDSAKVLERSHQIIFIFSLKNSYGKFTIIGFTEMKRINTNIISTLSK